MTRVIPLSPDLRPATRLVHAGWQFARAVLWQEQPNSPAEVERVYTLIRQHLGFPEIAEAAFTQFCERVLLAREAILTGQSSYLTKPAIWFDPGCRDGYAATLPLHQHYVLKTGETPGYRASYRTLVRHFYRYHLHQRRSAVSLCRRKLIREKAYGLLALLYRAVVYGNFSC